MARSFSNVKVVSAFIANEISAVVARKGYATAAAGGVGSSTVRNGAPAVLLKKKVSEESSKSAWTPDPVTGHYRPENQVKEVDPAELRAMHANNNNNNKGQ